MQLVERRGDQVNVKHILMKPRTSSLSLQKAKNRADSIYQLILNQTISFNEAILSFSDDESKNNDGLLINPITGSSDNTIDELGPSISSLVENLNQGEFTLPVKVESNVGSVYRIIYVKEKINAHYANLDFDYEYFQNLALDEMKQEKLKNWIEKKLNTVNIEIKDFKNCKLNYKWKK